MRFQLSSSSNSAYNQLPVSHGDLNPSTEYDVEVDAILTEVEDLRRPYVAQLTLQGISLSLAFISIILENNKHFYNND